MSNRITRPGKIAQPEAGLDSLRSASAALAGNVMHTEILNDQQRD
ncbi:hypothetical protein [Microbulbifer sp. JMSA003]